MFLLTLVLVHFSSPCILLFFPQSVFLRCFSIHVVLFPVTTFPGMHTSPCSALDITLCTWVSPHNIKIIYKDFLVQVSTTGDLLLHFLQVCAAYLSILQHNHHYSLHHFLLGIPGSCTTPPWINKPTRTHAPATYVSSFPPNSSPSHQ